ncbi:MAG: TonB family protein [Saccharospirillaceae bacterium]|nr:TonB family protein [Saccharospirillaceae bacterium]MCD8533204.1 TonB family protein [Saccharospirillaceae bacterium]
MSATAVTSSDRLSFALFLALLIHAVVILGISFTASDRDNLSKTLEVTLATYKSDKTPEKADFIAQDNQEGSGTSDEARMLTTDVEATFHANEINETSPQEQQASAPRQVQGNRQLVTTSGSSRHKVTSEQERRAMQVDLPDGPEKTLLERSLEMASLEAKLDSLRQTYARQPRIQRLTAASTMKASDAYYVNSWRRKIEQMGALNYPREAESCFDNCRLRLLVAINPDGTINELRILESSGKKVLDDAALRIVRLSAPFAPFTEEMRKQTDILEIIRTWQFKGNRYISDAN